MPAKEMEWNSNLLSKRASAVLINPGDQKCKFKGKSPELGKRLTNTQISFWALHPGALSLLAVQDLAHFTLPPALGLLKPYSSFLTMKA